MAGGAGHSVVFGQPHVVEELAAQRDRLRGGRVIWWYRDRRQPQWGLDIDNRADRPVVTRRSTSNAKDQQPGEYCVMNCE